MRSLPSLSLLVVGMLALGACTTPQETGTATPAAGTTATETAAVADPLRQARAENLNRTVDERFPAEPLVLVDHAGLETSLLFFDDSATLIIADPSDAAQLRAASIAAVTHAPVLIYRAERRNALIAEVERLGAERILLTGDVPLATTTGARTVVRDPGTVEALGELTVLQFTERTVDRPENMVAEVAALDPAEPTLLVPGWEELQTRGSGRGSGRLPAFPAQSRRDAQAAPVIVATAATPVVSVANARSYGAGVRVLDGPDPGGSLESISQVAGLAEGPLIALGEQFGDAGVLSARIEAGEEWVRAGSQDQPVE